jgi:hypothetical protein
MFGGEKRAFLAQIEGSFPRNQHSVGRYAMVDTHIDRDEWKTYDHRSADYSVAVRTRASTQPAL